MGNKGSLNGGATAYIIGVLRDVQRAQGWTLSDLEKRSGIPRTTIHGALSGRTLAVETLVGLGEGMGLDVGQLITEAARHRQGTAVDPRMISGCGPALWCGGFDIGVRLGLSSGWQCCALVHHTCTDLNVC